MVLQRLAIDLAGLVAAAVTAAGAQLIVASVLPGGVSASAGGGMLIELLLLVAAQVFVFLVPLALPLVLIAEVNGIRSWRFYAWAGLLLGAAGLLVLMTSAGGQGLRLVNAAAIAAFGSAGLAGGTAFWMAAGRRAGAAETADGTQQPRGEGGFAINEL